MSDLRVRIAPSPTGTVHLGLCRTALFNWAYARGRGGTFVLRVEDTDRTRSTQESETAILEGLRWLGIDWDEGPDVGGPHAPYRQSERIDGHASKARDLVQSGAAYRCFCTPERLDELKAAQEAAKETKRYDHRCRAVPKAESDERAAAGEPYAIRFRIPDGETRLEDLVRGDVRFGHDDVDDWIMVRRDGSPTYNFVVVCDDLAMEITHVIRGEEHLVNTPKQVLLYQAFGTTPPVFAHLPLMLGKDRKKLSKRSGDTALGDYVDAGYPKEAIVNFLCLQGWALDGETEVFDLETFVENFDVRNVQKAGAVFDIDKFRWLSGDAIRRMGVTELSDALVPFAEKAGLMTSAEVSERRDWFEALVRGEQARIETYSEFPPRVKPLFEPDDAVTYEEKAEKGARKHEARVETLRAFAEWITGRDDIDDPESLGAAGKAWVKEREIKFPALFQPLRCALLGQQGGRDLFDTIRLLGPESVQRRIAAAAERLG